ncbi:hypothetical protein FEM48_Zijuj08G0131400 [Ziziphus jujuba var. spinosa]|uniref:Uncharacterized protein n=1 Tax=Ziziphus jujuba var. spinosa TaxID=714518 RepID=A0A978UZA2_ZIZJJ|nr:hypothetical protein FEM48_Zijuj08G0131400 [Ziziphus jujuba var. spinosa]
MSIIRNKVGELMELRKRKEEERPSRAECFFGYRMSPAKRSDASSMKPSSTCSMLLRKKPKTYTQPQDGDEPLNTLCQGFVAEPFSSQKFYRFTLFNELGMGEMGSVFPSRVMRMMVVVVVVAMIAGLRSLQELSGRDSQERGSRKTLVSLHFYWRTENLRKLKKLKQRRMAKKLARKSLKMSSEEHCHQVQNLSSANEHQA